MGKVGRYTVIPSQWLRFNILTAIEFKGRSRIKIRLRGGLFAVCVH